MMEFIKYWLRVCGRSFRDSWKLLVPHSNVEILRSILIALSPFVAAWFIGPTFVQRRFMSADNVQDTAAWLILVAGAIVVLWVGIFVVHFLIVTPYRMWKDAQKEARNARTDPSLMAKVQQLEDEKERYQGYKVKYEEAFSYYKKSEEWQAVKTQLEGYISIQTKSVANCKEIIKNADFLSIKHEEEAYRDSWQRGPQRDIEKYFNVCKEISDTYREHFGEHVDFSEAETLRHDPLAFHADEHVQMLPEVSWQNQLRRLLDVQATNRKKIEEFRTRVESALSRSASMSFLDEYDPKG